MLLPGRCPLCRRVGPSPCAACASQLEQAPSLPAPAGVGQCRALVAYEGAGRELVARLKYRNARSTMSWLTNAMAGLIDGQDAAVVTWIPTTSRRRRQRGFDQAELLARGVARRLRLPCRALLRRADDSPQTGRSGIERRAGPSFVLRAPARRALPSSVLLVDDVITTGSTVTAAARALAGAGVTHVSVVAAARTPLKRVLAPPDIQVR